MDNNKIRIRPADIEIPECDPFKHDLLDRKRTIRTLTNLLQNLESPYTMSIDSSWGNGKTTFLNMWKQHLKDEKFPVIGFNAWETDFTGSPLVALTSELLKTLKCYDDQHNLGLETIETTLPRLHKTVLTKAIPGLISLVGGIVSIQTNDPSVALAGTTVASGLSVAMDEAAKEEPENQAPEPISYSEAKEAICSFKNALRDVAETLSEYYNDRPLIIAIDELDRCRPSYAVELLEIAKHLFAVDNIVFILAIDKTQLTHAIKALYGNEFDANGYLRRFIDLDFRLPDPDRTEFVAQQMNGARVLHHFDRYRINYVGPNAEVRHLLSEFLKSSSFSLRQIQQAVIRLGLALASIEPETNFSFPAFVLMLLLRTLDPVTFNRFVRSDMTDKEVSDHLFDSPGLRGVKQNEISNLFDALLIMADDEFRKKNNAQRKPIEVSLYSHYNAFTVARGPDPSQNSRAESVLNFLERYKIMHKEVSQIYYIGFADAAQHIELLYDILPDDPSPPDTPDTTHLAT